MKNLTTNGLSLILGRSRNERRGMRVSVMLDGTEIPVDESAIVTNLEENRFEIHVTKAGIPDGKLKAALDKTTFNSRAKFILANGNALYESAPVPADIPERFTVDNIEFKLATTTSDGVKIYKEVTP